MEILIISPGKNNEAFIQAGLDYYFKKIKNYHPVRLEHFSIKATADSSQNKNLEGEQILKKLQTGDWVVLLDERGKVYDNTQWAQQFQNIFNQSHKRLVFIIGGAFGVAESIKKYAQGTWSLGKLVFPHQLVRLILAEQVYRTLAILHQLPYHHQ